MKRLYFFLFLTLGLVPCAHADEARQAAEQAMRDAQATNNPYVVEAVRTQLIADNPAHAAWLKPTHAGEAGRVDAYAFPDNAPVTPADAKPAKSVVYAGEFQGGFQADSGNSEGSSLNSKAKLTRENQDWLFLLQGSAAVDRSDGETSKETYSALAQANYKIEDDLRWLTTIYWYSNRFIGFSDRFDEVTGIGQDWDLPYGMELSTEIAAGARQVTLIDDTSTSEPILWLRGNYHWPISERLSFTQELRNSAGPKYNFFFSSSALTLALDDPWKLRFAFELDYVNNPPLDREPVDTNTLINLVYGF